jgi:rhodanese-related sulfurtransferase
VGLIRSGDLFALLNAQKHLPYIHFPKNRQHILGDVLRVFDLIPGDKVSLASSGHAFYVSVLEGIVEATGEDGSGQFIRRGETKLIKPNVDAIDLRSSGGAQVCVADIEIIEDLMSFETLIDNAEDQLSMSALERARRSNAFRRVPLECVEEAFRRMGQLSVAAGNDVIRQGDPGELFYVLVQGKAEVWKIGIYDDEPKKVDDLEPGDAFGEEALIISGTRSATIRITEDAKLLTLGKADYQALISRELVNEVEPSVALTMVNTGYKLLDVRYAEEHEDIRIPGSQLIPLNELRTRSIDLDKSARWIVYCRSGKRSAVATLLLKQEGFRATSLKGGMSTWPYESESDIGALAS